MRTVVTGGCGFIGQHVVNLLVNRYGVENVLVVDAKTHAATGWDRVADLYKDTDHSHNLVQGSVENYQLMSEVVGRFMPDVVIHMAAQSHVDASLENPVATWQTNAVGTQVLAEICAMFGIPLSYCSTDEVYGSTPLHLDTGEPIEVDEDYPLNPSSPYSASKAAGELAIRAMGRSLGLKWAITRGSNAWGENQLPEKLVPIACAILKAGGSVPLHGGGRQLRTWVHVEEFADAVYRVAHGLAFDDMTGCTYNIAGKRTCSVRELVMAFAMEAGANVTEASWGSTDRPGQDTCYCIDGARLNHAYAWEPVRDILDPKEIRLLLKHYGDKDISPRLAEYVSRRAS